MELLEPFLPANAQQTISATLTIIVAFIGWIKNIKARRKLKKNG